MTSSAKFVLLSTLLFSILVPARAAAEKNARVGLKKALINMTIFNFIYVMAVTYLYPRLL